MRAGGHALSQLAQVLKPLRTLQRHGLRVLSRTCPLSLFRQLLSKKSQQRLAVGTRSLRNRSLEFFEAHGLRRLRLADESLKNDLQTVGDKSIRRDERLDIELLPNNVFMRLLESARKTPSRFKGLMTELFTAMAK